MTTTTIQNYTMATEYGIESIDADSFLRMGRCILIIAGGDGELSAKEIEAAKDVGRRLGAPPEMSGQAVNFDWKHANLKDNLPVGLTTGWKHMMLYLAITIASADGAFHPGERAQVAKAAEGLGVSPGTLAAIEAMAAAEDALRAGRLRLFSMK